MVPHAAERSSNIKAVGSPLDKDRLTSFLCREELSQMSDRFYMQTDMDCLSYEHKYVPPDALQPLVQPILI